MWLLWDTSAILPYYVPEMGRNQSACDRAKMIIDAVRHRRLSAHFYIPNLVIAEVFTQFDKSCYSRWDKQVGRNFGGNGRTLDKRRWATARKKFRNDIHNGKLFYQYELNRYHILALDLLGPIDKHRKYYRSKNVKPMGTTDLLIGAMALHLARLHGREKVLLVSTDRRMQAIFSDVPSQLNAKVVKKLSLDATAEQLGFGDWDSRLYPQVLDLARCTDNDLIDALGQWPLNTRRTRNQRPIA